MGKRSATTAVAILGAVLVTYAQSGQRVPGASAPSTARTRPATSAPAAPRLALAATPAAPAISDDEQRAFFTQYCVTCHSERAKAAGMDSARKLSVEALDPGNVAHDAKTWELVVRKLRAGMMPPAGLKRPDPPVFDAMIASFEAELDGSASPNTPAPGLHRLNRTEYQNVVRDLLNLDIDASKYLPSDDSTSGFDNIAGALGLSSTLVEAYVRSEEHTSELQSQ